MEVPGTVDAVRRVSPAPTARAAAEVWALTVVVHAAAGGGLPSVPWLVGVAGLVALSTGWVLRRSVRLAVMVPVLAVSQVGLHEVLAGMAPAGQVAHGHDGLSPRMAAAHLMCAVLTGVLWWLRRWVVQVVLALAAPFVAVVRRRPAGVGLAVRQSWRAGLLWLAGDPGRAPPRGSVSA